jgi:hypothetical protein
LPDPAADLDQAQPRRVQLHPRNFEFGQPTADRVEQPAGRPVQQEAELVGPEPVVAQAVGEAGPLEVLDPVLRLAPVGVPGVDRLRRVCAFVVLNDPSGPLEGIETDPLLFVQTGDRWLVDAIVPFTEVDEDDD